MITVVQHEPDEGPGTLGPLLGEHLLVETFAGVTVPRTCDALVVLGGGMSAQDVPDEVRLVRRCLDEGKPVLGICLGSQVLALAAGGTVARAPRKEIGFYRVRLSDERDALFDGAPRDFVAFHWHGDAFTLPPGAAPLASSTLTPLQAFRYGPNAWGVQFHLEIDLPVLQAMIASGGPELESVGVKPDLLLLQAQRELQRIRSIATGVFSRWMALAHT